MLASSLDETEANRRAVLVSYLIVVIVTHFADNSAPFLS